MNCRFCTNGCVACYGEQLKTDRDNSINAIDWQPPSEQLINALRTGNREGLTAGDMLRFDFVQYAYAGRPVDIETYIEKMITPPAVLTLEIPEDIEAVKPYLSADIIDGGNPRETLEKSVNALFNAKVAGNSRQRKTI